jgi:ZIP family zinc transporter
VVLVFLISIATFLMTLLGGLVALRFQDRLHLVLGFSAGAVIGVAFFDLIPESIELIAPRFSAGTALTVAAVGFVIYMVLDRTVAPHDHGHDHDHDHAHAHEAGHAPAWHRGLLGAGSLAVHSFLDGFAIGLAFHVSDAVGAVLAAAVLMHDFSDGINTVGIVLGKTGERRMALRWLLVNAAAPVLGAATTMLVSLPKETIGLMLALFAGFFVYISASDLLPESYHDHPTRWTTAMTIAGVAAIFVVIQLAG